MKIAGLFFISLLFTTLSFCNQVNSKEPTKKHTPDKTPHLYVGGYGGYGVLDGGYSQDGQYAQYRFTIGVDNAFRCGDVAIGAEGGIQSGNTMRIKMNQTLVDLAGGLPPQAILKPFLDFLVVGRWSFFNKFQLLLKGGFAYRQLQFVDRTSPKDSLRKINGELQAGLGYQLTKHTRLVALYQGIYSKSNLGATLNKNTDVLMHHIPTQQAGLFGIEYSF